MEKLRVIFVGIPDMALICLTNLLKAGFDIVGVVPPKKTHETYNFFKKFVLDKNLNFLEFDNSPNDSTYIEKIKALNADIGVVCSYNDLLSKEFLSSTKFGYINSHPSLLPEYRGANPYFHIINNGETHSGITLHFMDETFDTGDIVSQKKFPIMRFETMGTLFNRTTYMISDAIIETLNNLQKDGDLKRLPQKKEALNKAPKVGSEFRIRWNKSIYQIDRLIRACNPFSTAFTTFRGVSVKIIEAEPIELEHDFEFGRIVKATNNELHIAAKDGVISVKIAQIGTWGYFSPESFYNSFSPNDTETML